jgi:hypothetical protein
MKAETTVPSGLTCKITKINQYVKNKRMVFTYIVTGSKAAVAQYEADQDTRSDKGCQYDDVTKAPLFWSNDIGDTIARRTDGDWRVDNDVERAVTQQINRLDTLGQSKLADKLADRLADKMLSDITAMFSKSKPKSVAPAAEEASEEQTKQDAPENLDGV